MKVTNLKKADSLCKVLTAIETALEDVEKFLSAKDSNSLCHEATSAKGLYQLYISEFRDMSRNRVDLTNCGVGMEVLQFIEMQLKLKREKIVQEIEAL
jgi:hypothetical protein